MKRKLIAYLLSTVLLVGCGANKNPPNPPTQDDEVEESLAVANLSEEEYAGTRQGVMAQKAIEVTPTSGGLPIPISSIPDNTVLYVHVIVDLWQYKIMAYRDEVGRYHLSYNLCEKCISTGHGQHLQWMYNDSTLYTVCQGCANIYNLSTLGDASARQKDACIPLEITRDEYSIVRIKDIEFDLSIYPWMQVGTLDADSYGIPATPYTLLKDKDAIVIPYTTLAKANEIFDEWLLNS